MAPQHYCLGYGENELLDARVVDNRGTPQFWKLFFSCCNKISRNDDFWPILHSGVQNIEDRLQNKLKLLNQMKEKGIWLVDASIVGLYPKPDWLTLNIKETILRKCWEYAIKPQLSKLPLKHIICVGHGIANILHRELEENKIPFTIVYQPNAHLSTIGHVDNYNSVFSICETNTL